LGYHLQKGPLMTILENSKCRVFLKKGRSKVVQNRHPWIFSGAIARVEGACQPGDIVAVYSADDQFLAKGFINPNSQIRLRLLSFRQEEIAARFFQRRIERALELRKLFISAQTNAYRLVHSEGDLLPGLVVDRYGKVLAVQFNSLGIANLKTLIVDILDKLIRPEAIVERSEASALAEEGLTPLKTVLQGQLADRIQVIENGIKFWVDVMEGQKTGFYLDQRDNRRRIGELAAGKKVLNCFAYTGGFSIYAALNNAFTTSVDASADALALAEENFALNGLDPVGHRFAAGNVFEFLRDLPAAFYDLIILDPPAFVKNRQHINTGARGYKDINRLAIRQVKDGGLVLTCSCSALVTWDLFRKIIFSAAREAGRAVQILAQPGQPPDHPINIFHAEGEYLKTLLMRVYD
jgi:23S rRNA (cytosine1962-C5)-methyltransferase